MFKKIIKFSVVILIGASVIGGAFIWSGAFNIAANDKHWDITTSMLEVMRDKSIAKRSQSLTAPNLTDKERIARAAPNYAAMCATCHLSPRVDKSELFEGLYPQPPAFAKASHIPQSPEDTFWVIKNGLKMTGMPAWGIYNSDRQIWDLVALVNTISTMSAKEYQTLVDAGEHTHEKGGHSGSMNMKDKGHDNSDGHHSKPKVPAGHDNSDGHHDH